MQAESDRLKGRWECFLGRQHAAWDDAWAAGGSSFSRWWDGRHVAWHMQGKSYEKNPLDPPVDFARISSLESVAICSQCQTQSATRAPGPDGELNYSHGPEAFFKQYKLRPYAEFYLNAHYKDGRFRQTSFIVESFLRSSCFRKGGATCVSCHDPHHDDAGSNPTSLLFRSEPNRMCTQCHGEFNNPANLHKHTRHPLNSEGSKCVSCHMPRIMNALMSRARTRRIDDIPNARMTEQFEPRQSPNACLLCHGEWHGPSKSRRRSGTYTKLLSRPAGGSEIYLHVLTTRESTGGLRSWARSVSS